MSRTRGMRASALTGALLGSAAVMAGGWVAVATAAPGEDEPRSAPTVAAQQTIPASEGGYRLPYADGVVVSVVEADAGVYELTAREGSVVVAASSGWVRSVPTGDTADGALWIEHPTGEFSGYTGLAPGGEPPAVGDWMDAGDALGSATTGMPLRWEVVEHAAFSGATDALSAGSLPSGDGLHRAAQVCGIPATMLTAGEHVAAACDNASPHADPGVGPLIVDEGQPVPLDAGRSVDPEGEPLTYRWELAGLDIDPVVRPQVIISDDFEGSAMLTVYDRTEGRWDAASVDVIVRNAPPSVEAVAVSADEGGIGRVRATVADPGDDTLVAQIDWGDGSPAQQVTIAELAAGVDHVYGDDGAFPVTVTATDDDGGVGAHAVPLQVVGLAPDVQLDVSGTVAFPGGRFAVTAPGVALRASADAADAGSDDLAFAWSNGREVAFAAAAGSSDPPLSPFGAFPVGASDATDHTFPAPGVEIVRVVVRDDDGGTTDASISVIVTGSETTARPAAWWIREFASLDPSARLPVATAAYLDIVQAASGVFSELEPVTTPAEAVAVLAAQDGGLREKSRAALLRTWLVFAAGAVSPDATVTLSSGADVAFLDLMADAEAEIASPSSTDEDLRGVLDDLSRVSD